jgi:MFS family permease
VAGSVAILGNTVAGRMSDHIGRRPTLIAALLLNCVATVIFYNSGGWILPLAWIGTLFGYFAVEVVVNATSGELFPTSCRSTASTLRAAVAMFAAVAGLTIEGQLYEHLGSHERALTLMSLSSLLAIPVVALLLRETSHTELR